MPLNSTHKTALTTLLESTYSVTPVYGEQWMTPAPRESSDPTKKKLILTMDLPGKGRRVTYMTVVDDETQASVDTAFQSFLNAMTNAIAANRNPFQL